MEVLFGSMNKKPCIDVVIVNYNSGPALMQCVDSIDQVDGIKLYVVDNNSNDNSLDFLTTQRSDILLIKNDCNLGFAKASNQGAMKGKAEQLAFINPDCFIKAEQLQQLARDLMNHAQAGLIGCRVLNEDGSLQPASRRRLPTFWRVMFHLIGLSKLPFIKGININDEGMFSEIKTVEAVNGACLMLSRKVFEELSGFDDTYPLHFEDLDLFIRMQNLGKKLIYQSNIAVKHIKGQANQNPQLIKNWKQQGLVKYFNKHRPAWEAKLISWMVGLR